MAVVEKGKAPGAHLLSGAVVNPRAFRQLFPGMHSEDMPFRVEGRARGPLLPDRQAGAADPGARRRCGTTATIVASISEIGAWLAERAEEGGATIVPETAARKLLVSGGRVVGIRTGDRGRGPRRRGAPELRAGLRHHGAGDDPRRGDAGPPHRRRARPLRPAVAAADLGARREGGVGGPEAAQPRHPHHGLAAPRREEVPGVRRQLHLPAGRRTWWRSGWSSGSTTPTPRSPFTTSCRS